MALPDCTERPHSPTSRRSPRQRRTFKKAVRESRSVTTSSGLCSETSVAACGTGPLREHARGCHQQPRSLPFSSLDRPHFSMHPLASSCASPHVASRNHPRGPAAVRRRRAVAPHASCALARARARALGSVRGGVLGRQVAAGRWLLAVAAAAAVPALLRRVLAGRRRVGAALARGLRGEDGTFLFTGCPLRT